MELDKKNLLKMVIDHYKGITRPDFSATDYRESIREALINLNNGSTKIDYRAIRDGKCSGLFAFIEEAITKTVIEGLPESNPLFNYVDFRNIANGDKPIFKIKENVLYIVADLSKGNQSLRRQRLLNEKKVTLSTHVIGIKVYEEIERILAGLADFNDLINDASKSLQLKLNTTMYNAIIAAFDSKITPYKATGTFNEEKLSDLIEHVETATGQTAIILGSRKAVRKITGVRGADASSAKEDLYNLGYFGKFYTNPIIVLKNGHKEGTDEFILPDDKLFIIAGDDKFIKLVTEGDTLIIPDSPTDNIDLTQTYTILEKFGIAVIFSNKGAAEYDMA